MRLLRALLSALYCSLKLTWHPQTVLGFGSKNHLRPRGLVASRSGSGKGNSLVRRQSQQENDATSFWGRLKPRSITNTSVSNEDMLALEKEVLSRTQAELDLRAVKQALLEADGPANKRQSSVTAPQWTIAAAASITIGSLVFILTQNILFGIVASIGIGFVASRDPIEEVDAAGALARTVGRYTLSTAEAAAPRAKALARAALASEDEITDLNMQIETLKQQNLQLEDENVRLKLWQRNRLWVDETLSFYNLQELKERARENNLPVGGTKAQLLLRLVEAGVVNPGVE